MLAALPADAAVVFGARSPTAEVLDLLVSGQDLAGPIHPWQVDRVAGACDVRGCGLLAEGDFASLDKNVLANAFGGRVRGEQVQVGPLRWQRLSDDKAVLGERTAVSWLRRINRQQRDRLDPARLDGWIPLADAWIASDDPSTLSGLLEERGLDLPLVDGLDRIDAVALGVDGLVADDGLTLDLRLRLVAFDDADARRIARLLPRVTLIADADPRLQLLLDRAEIAQDGPQVEVRSWLGPSEWRP